MAARDSETDRTSAGAAVRFPVPPLLFVIPLAGALAVDRHLLRLSLPGAGAPAMRAAGVAVCVGGALLSLSGVLAVLRRRTTVVPHRPVAHLVTTGPFRLTRNPMYAGLAVVVTGVALRTGSWWPLIVAPLSVRATTRLVVLAEEEYLADRFGAEYERYRSRVRRWI